MPVQPWTEDRRAQVRAALSETMPSARAPRVVNTRFALNPDGDDTLLWNDREYQVPPIPWEAGAELLEIQSGLAQLAQKPDAPMREYRILMRRAVGLLPRLIRRPLRWIRPNPFRRASGQQIGELIGFFYACQMKPPVGTRLVHPGDNHLRST